MLFNIGNEGELGEGEVPVKWQLSWLIFMVMRLNELQEKIVILLAAG